MAKGIEGGRLNYRGAETQIIHKESSKRTPESLIATQRRLAEEAVMHSRLVTVLQGEEGLPFIANNKDAERQLSMAKMLLLNTPFLNKFMPVKLDDEEKAALIVSIAQVIQEQRQQMN